MKEKGRKERRKEGKTEEKEGGPSPEQRHKKERKRTIQLPLLIRRIVTMDVREFRSEV